MTIFLPQDVCHRHQIIFKASSSFDSPENIIILKIINFDYVITFSSCYQLSHNLLYMRRNFCFFFKFLELQIAQIKLEVYISFVPHNPFLNNIIHQFPFKAFLMNRFSFDWYLIVVFARMIRYQNGCDKLW